MKRDPNQFRERFNRWRSGELVYSSGRPIEYDGGKSEDSPLVKLLYNNDANAWYMNDPYMRELALKDVVKKTIDSYPSPYQPPVVHYSSDIPTTRSKFNVYQDGYSDIILGTSTLKNNPNDYYNYKGNPLRTAAHEVAHYYDNLTERLFRTDDDSNSNFKFPEYNLDKLLDSPTGLYSVLMHDMKPSERYADRIAAEIVPGYDRYENTKRKYRKGKSPLKIPKFLFGTNEHDPKKSLSEAIAIADKQEAEMKRRTGHGFNKDLGNKDLQVLSDGLHNNQTKFTEGIAKTAQILNQKRSDAAKEEVRHYKNMANAVSTAAELASSYFMIAKGLRDLKLIRDWRILSDKAQTIMSGTGTAADFVQLNMADKPHEKLENAVELPFDVAGIIGGTNWARRTPLFGKYGDKIDTMLDIAGYGAALWDGVVKPTNWMINRMSRPIIKSESK